MLIPCNPLSYIEQAYGSSWNVPIQSEFYWKNMNQKYFDKYSKKDWQYARRFYNEFGKLNVNKTISYLNEINQDNENERIIEIDNDIEENF